MATCRSYGDTSTFDVTYATDDTSTTAGCVTLSLAPDYDREFTKLMLDVALKKPQPVNGSFKRLSPKRVSKRRQKNKASRAARKRGRLAR